MFKPSVFQQTLVREQIISRAPTHLSYIERSVSVKNVDAQKGWFFGLRVKSSKDVPIYVMVGFQNRDGFHKAATNTGIFYRPRFFIPQINIGKESFLEKRTNIDYAKDTVSQDYEERVLHFRHSSRDNILRLYKSQHDIRRDEQFRLYVFDERYQKHFSSPHNVKKDFTFRNEAAHVISAGTVGYELIWTIQLLSISSDCHRYFDLF